MFSKRLREVSLPDKFIRNWSLWVSQGLRANARGRHIETESHHELFKLFFTSGYHLIDSLIIRDFIFLLQTDDTVSNITNGKYEALCVFIYTHTYVYHPINLAVHTYVCMCVYIQTHKYIYVYVLTYCTYIHIYVLPSLWTETYWQEEVFRHYNN